MLEPMTRDQVVLLTLMGVVRLLKNKSLWRLNLAGLDLSGIEFRNTDLFGCDLRFCDLTSSNFREALIQGVIGLVSMGSLGPGNDILYAWRKYNADRTSFEVIFVTGCFEGTEKAFRQEINERLAEDPGGYVVHAELYRRAINLLKLMLQQHYPFEDQQH